MTDDPEEISLPLVYVDVDESPVVVANQFVIQHEGEQFILTVGQLQPPIILGTSEEKIEQARRLSHVPIRIVGRFGLTRDRLAELIEALQSNLRTYDEKKG